MSRSEELEQILLSLDLAGFLRNRFGDQIRLATTRQRDGALEFSGEIVSEPHRDASCLS